MWSDRQRRRRGQTISHRDAAAADAVRRLTGTILDAASPAAKLAWLDEHEPDVMQRARWMLSPRDFVVREDDREVATDPTLAQSSGFYDSIARARARARRAAGATCFPPVLASSAVAGTLRSDAADELGSRPDCPSSSGAGDRPCEVLGHGGRTSVPMVSWGTTANVSVPTRRVARVTGLGVVVSRGAEGGFLIEAGLSSAGSFLDWLASLVRHPSAAASAARAGPQEPAGRERGHRRQLARRRQGPVVARRRASVRSSASPPSTRSATWRGRWSRLSRSR